MNITEYTVSYTTPENKFGDVIYRIQTKREAIKQAGDLVRKGATSVWINLHIDDDIVGDIQIL